MATFGTSISTTVTLISFASKHIFLNLSCSAAILKTSSFPQKWYGITNRQEKLDGNGCNLVVSTVPVDILAPFGAGTVMGWFNYHRYTDTKRARQHPDDVTKWKYLPRHWPFVRGIHRLPVDSLHKGHWREVLMFFFDLRMNKQLRK